MILFELIDYNNINKTGTDPLLIEEIINSFFNVQFLILS